MKEIRRDNSIIDYNITGNAPITLLFVHGAYIDQTYWNKQLDYFNFNYTVVTLDLPGHGKSGYDRTNWSVKGFAADVVTVIKELDLRNVILIGHSLGGEVNMVAATSYPERIIGFISIDIFKNAAAPLPAEFESQVATIEENLKKDFANTNEHYARMTLLSKDTSTEITERMVNAYRNAYQPMAQAIMPEIFKMDQVEKELLPVLNLKLHLINVDYKPTNEDALKKIVADRFELFNMRGTCHYPMLENPDEFNDLLQKAIDDITRDMV